MLKSTCLPRFLSIDLLTYQPQQLQCLHMSYLCPVLPFFTSLLLITISSNAWPQVQDLTTALIVEVPLTLFFAKNVMQQVQHS